MSAAVSRLPRLACTIRRGKPDDLAFIVDSWTKHGHRGERMRDATRHVRSLLARDPVALAAMTSGEREGSIRSLLVAHVPDDANAILGWALIEASRTDAPTCIQYVYVRSTARLQGVARSLLSMLEGEAVEHSLPSKLAPAVWIFNPERAVTA
jgi:GNAT superfamily N-acetyltransferase